MIINLFRMWQEQFSLVFLEVWEMLLRFVLDARGCMWLIPKLACGYLVSYDAP